MKRILAAAALMFVVAFWPPPATASPYLNSLREASDVILGKNGRSDVAQDFYGFRAMVLHQDPYAVLGPALETIGVDWDLAHASTHPPTAFLLVAPVAWMPWPLSSLAWAWLMIAALFVSFHAAGYSWKTSALMAALAILWTPTIHSLSQITIVWLLGLMLAYRFRSSNPFLAGIFVGIASLTKFLPAIMLVPFVVRRRGKAVLGFGMTWLAALSTILLIAPQATIRYLKVNRTNALATLLRGDNSSPIGLLLSHRLVGMELVTGLMLALVLATFTVLLLRRAIGQDTISTNEWNFYSYLSVALLPIMWIYSIVPLLPILMKALTGRNVPAVWAAAAILLAIVAPPFAHDTRYFLFSVLLLSGGVVIAMVTPELAAGRGQLRGGALESTGHTD
jgi:hypothetical protein